MSGDLTGLFQRAFGRAPAREANQAIARARREAAGSDPDDEDGAAFRSYELVLEDGASWPSLERELLPRLVYHLESVGAHLPHAHGVVLAVFAAGELRFFHARDFIDEACKALGVPPAELVRRYGTGESRTAQRDGPPLALPPGDS